MKKVFFYIIVIALWGALGTITYYNSLYHPSGSEMGQGLIYMIYLGATAVLALLALILMPSFKKFLIFASIPVLIPTVEMLKIVIKHNS